MPDFTTYLYIDYENVQDIQVSALTKAMKVKIIYGLEQKKFPAELVTKLQPFGDAVEWIGVEGKGSNALDFFIAYYLGKEVAQHPTKQFIIYSKDTGFDPLITHLSKAKIALKRIVSFKQLNGASLSSVDDPNIRKIIDLFKKIKPVSRPKKRKTLTSAITDLMKGMSQTELDRLIDDLFIRKIVYEENGNIKYDLDHH
jgi:hypothetical protein